MAILSTWVLIGPWPRSWVECPFFNSDPTAINESRWQSIESAGQTIPSEGEIAVGVGVVNLSDRMQQRFGNTTFVPLAGHGRRTWTQGNIGMADPIQVKSISITVGPRTLLWVTADLLLINRRLVNETLVELDRRGWRIPRENILFGATHTHSSYAGFTDRWIEMPSMGFHRPHIAQTIVQALADACEKSLREQTRACMAHVGKDLSADDLVIHRIDRKLPANGWLDVIGFQTRDTRQWIASVTVFSPHATCRPKRNSQISADYPGVLTRQVEEATMAPSLFFAGAVGSMGPVDLGSPREAWAEKLGTHLAHRVLQSLNSMNDFVSRTSATSALIELALPTGQIKMGQDYRCSPLLSRNLVPTASTLHGLRIGSVAFLSVPADFSGDLAGQLRQKEKSHTLVCTSFGGDYVGYILPNRFADLPTYEARSASLLGKEAGSFFVNHLERLNRLLLDPSPSTRPKNNVKSIISSIYAN
ncbi:hypothetical protein K2X85_09985 [bacterium]|nr:hypothetical protein [bacterium]